MNWPSAEAALRTYIETGWAASAYADVPLVWENTLDEPGDLFVSVAIEGTYTDKTIYGSPGLRCAIDAGVIHYHAFTPVGSGKMMAVVLVDTMGTLLELRSVDQGINTDGANPPSPIEIRGLYDRGIPIPQPHGNYYRCSGSVPFIVIDVR